MYPTGLFAATMMQVMGPHFMAMMVAGSSPSSRDETDELDEHLSVVRCPLCLVKHEYAPIKVQEMHIYLSGKLPCITCSKDCGSGETTVALNCGHAVCSLYCQDTICSSSELACDKCTLMGAVTPKRYSHGAGAVCVPQGGSVRCPICLEDYRHDASAVLVVLACGHVVCEEDFVRLGGHMGNNVLHSRQEIMGPWAIEVEKFFTAPLGRRLLSVESITGHLEYIKVLCSQSRVLETEVALALLHQAIFSGDGLRESCFVMMGGPKVVSEALARFDGNPRVVYYGFLTLYKVCKTKCSNSESALKYTKAVVDPAGILATYVRVFRKSQNFPQPVLDLMGLFFQWIFETKQASSTDIASALNSLLMIIVEQSNGKVLCSTMKTASALLENNDISANDAKQLQQPAINVMQQHFVDERVLSSAIDILFQIMQCTQTVGAEPHRLAVSLVNAAMSRYSSARSVQEVGCGFFRAVLDSAKPSQEDLVEDLFLRGPMEAIEEAMSAFPDDDMIVWHACAALASAVDKFEGMTVRIGESHSVERICGAIKRFEMKDPDVSFQCTRVLRDLARSNSPKVRNILLSSNALPALDSLGDESCELLYRPFLLGQRNPSTLVSIVENVKETLRSLGYAETFEIGEDENQNLAVESPPFDVASILGKNLMGESAPGWYNLLPFYVDSTRSQCLTTTHNVPFLIQQPGRGPQRDIDVCLRVSLPLGGRGWLYGKVVSVAMAPTDDELRESGSALFENPCKCPDPGCPFRDVSHEGIIRLHGVVHGQEVTANVGLKSPYMERDAKYEPLPSFFGDEDTRFDVTLRWNDRRLRYEVVRLAFAP